MEADIKQYMNVEVHIKSIVTILCYGHTDPKRNISHLTHECKINDKTVGKGVQ